MSETRDCLSIGIDNILAGQSCSPLKPSIFRADPFMNNKNKNILVPTLVSIGPIHHGKPHLQMMQHHKIRLLKSLLRRRNESSTREYVEVIRSLEERARKCYADPIDLSPDEFVKMLLLDACFILELTRKFIVPEHGEREDPIFKYDHMRLPLISDIMLVENQIPFFVLDQLFEMTNNENQDTCLRQQIWFAVYCEYPFPELRMNPTMTSFIENPDHLLDLMYKAWRNIFADVIKTKKRLTWVDIKSATELQEAGIRFEKDTESYFLDIKFSNNGVMKIPVFTISDETEVILLNLILHEHFIADDTHPWYVTDYTCVLQCLINSSKDVELLRLKGVLNNVVSDDVIVYDMIKDVDRYTYSSEYLFCYADVFDKVNKHCSNPWNTWMAILRHNYFNTPWAFISFLAAVVLLILTLIQTVFSVLH